MKALRKDFYVQIKKTISRFISILLIVALGSAFYAGIRSTEPDMRLSADKMYDNEALMDIRIMSTLGLTEDDVNTLLSLDSVDDAVGSYSEDVIAVQDEKECVVKVLAYTDSVNVVQIQEGRLPESEDECIIDTQFAESGYEIGSTINFGSDNLSQEDFTIVGTFTSSYYLTRDRETTSIGNGDVEGIAVVCPDIFALDYYTDIYVLVSGAGDLVSYTDEYNDCIQAAVDDIENNAMDICIESRYNSIIDEANAEIEDAQEELDEAVAEYEDGVSALDDAKAQLAQSVDELAAARQLLGENDVRIFEMEQELAAAKVQIEENEAKLDSAKQEIDDARADIDEARAEVEDIERPEWYVLDRSYIQSYAGYGQDAEKIGNIGRVVPAIFFIVAAMVSLNTMTRMVNEDRTKIGTLKALGYSNLPISLIYIVYGFLATIIGAVAGGIAGSKILPYIIMDAYKLMYLNLTVIVQQIHVLHFSVSVGASIISVIGATLLACIRTFKASPAELMRPESPKQGRRVLLERVTFIWKRLNFQKKSTVRNLFRYKKRLFMTLFGISGCMALMVLGFGLKDSINYLSDVQYVDIVKYDATVSLNDDAEDGDIDSALELISRTDGVEEYMRISRISTDICVDDTEVTGYVMVPEYPEDIDNYVHLANRVGGGEYTLNESGAVISEKLSKLLDVNIGDTIYIIDGDADRYAVTISGIFENYVYHYVYLTPALYEELYGEVPKYNTVIINGDDGLKENKEEISTSFLKNSAVSSVTFISDTWESFNDMLGSLDIIIIVLVVSAGLLAFVVLFNLNNINIAERRRELATLKVLGFYDGEVSAYIYRENMLITLIGIIIGVALGAILHKFIIASTEIDIMMFGRQVKAMSFVYSALLTLAFAVIINFVMHFKLKDIDMASSLKSVE